MLRALLAALGLCTSAGAWAGIPTFCEKAKDIGAAEQDRVLRFAGAVKAELARSGARVALVARSGLDLSRFGLLYSHAGVALAGNPAGPWAVRQLYYACDESRPRLFDQGMFGFVLGADTPAHGHVTLLFPPAADSALLERAALDKPRALALLADRYSANAYAFGTRYQNCNQWVAELLASAWGRLDDSSQGGERGEAGDDDAGDGGKCGVGGDGANAGGAHAGGADAGGADADGAPAARTRAQAWLRAHGYRAGPVRVPSRWVMFAGQFVPLVHLDDHPLDDLYALALRTSVPASIEAFVQRQAPATRRVELCHDERRIVVHRGWEALGADCAPLPGDEVIDIGR